MRTHGWGGDPPADDEEAVARILAATRTCIERDGGETGIVDVAAELGVTRQTVYRYFAGTQALLTAAALTEVARFEAELDAHLAAGPRSLPDVVVECVAYALERIPLDPFIGLVVHPGVGGALRDITSPTARALGRAIVDRLPVDWEAEHYDDRTRDELVEFLLRTLQSFYLDPGDPPRTGTDLRRYLTRWVAPAVAARGRLAEA